MMTDLSKLNSSDYETTVRKIPWEIAKDLMADCQGLNLRG